MVEMHKGEFLKRRIHYSSIVSDDDSTMRVSLRHSYNDLVDAGYMDKKAWKKSKIKRKKR
mgnify:CR=1 FL=1